MAAARKKIAAGTSSLRAAAAEIGCRPSTLSARITKAKAAEADARVRLGIREPASPTRMRADSQPAASGARAGTPAAEGDPVEVLRGALQATKANGQPDWQIRLSAARTLAALPPEEPEPEPDSATLVYDLPPGSSPILHCAPPSIFAPANTTEPPPEPLPEPGLYMFMGDKRSIFPLVRHAADDGAEVHTLTQPRSRSGPPPRLRRQSPHPRLGPVPGKQIYVVPALLPTPIPNERRVAVPAVCDSRDLGDESVLDGSRAAPQEASSVACGTARHLAA